VFSIYDWNSERGGGYFNFTSPKWVELFTVQREAAVHECAHAAWWAVERLWPLKKDPLVRRLCAEFARQADMPQHEYGTVRRLCHVYRYGDGNWLGMWEADKQRWNHDEVFAGLASGTMGDMSLMPPALRSIFGHVFKVPKLTYLPFVRV
jgi:hypothetical protein